MKLLPLVFLFCTAMLVVIPAHSIAAFYTTGNTTAKNNIPLQHRQNKYSHMPHFRGGHVHSFCGIFGLGCSMIGSVAVVAALAAVIVAAPAGVFAIAAYGFSLLGIVLGFISLSDSDGSTAVMLGFANLLVLWLEGAIYQATLGNFVPLLRLAAVFVK